MRADVHGKLATLWVASVWNRIPSSGRSSDRLHGLDRAHLAVGVP